MSNGQRPSSQKIRHSPPHSFSLFTENPPTTYLCENKSNYHNHHSHKDQIEHLSSLQSTFSHHGFWFFRNLTQARQQSNKKRKASSFVCLSELGQKSEQCQLFNPPPSTASLSLVEIVGKLMIDCQEMHEVFLVLNWCSCWPSQVLSSSFVCSYFQENWALKGSHACNSFSYFFWLSSSHYLK